MARLAARLAVRHGEDPGRARLAGWLHDWLKPLGPARAAAVIRRYHGHLDARSRDTPALWHGPAAACWARAILGIRDDAVLDAVWWHSTGRAGMSRLGRLLFIADFSSEDRAFPEAARARVVAHRSLEGGLRYVLAAKLAWLADVRLPVHPGTLGLWREACSRAG